jgi:hypothetical protein
MEGKSEPLKRVWREVKGEGAGSAVIIRHDWRERVTPMEISTAVITAQIHTIAPGSQQGILVNVNITRSTNIIRRNQSIVNNHD